MMAVLNSTLKAILIDLSGTLHVENYVIPGAIEALEKLRQTNVVIKFVTNTTKESRQCLYQRLLKLGFKIEEHEIFSSLWAARDLILARELNPLLLVDDAALEDFTEVIQKGNKDYNSVVVGLAPERFNYEELNKAFSILCTKGNALIAIHEGRYYKRSDGLALGPGPFVKGLEYAAECKSEVVGKPSANFFRAALGDINPEQAVMIGDDVRDDIAGAQSLGVRGFLVQTGKYRPGDEEKILPNPFKICMNFPQAAELIIKELNANEKVIYSNIN